MRGRTKSRIVVAFNRDFEGAEGDPENKAREDIKNVAEDVLGVLDGAGFETIPIGVTSDAYSAVRAIKQKNPAIVFNLCESIRGENRFEPLLPLLFDLEGIAFTGSPPFSLSLALRKDKAKEVLRARNVPTPAGLVVTGEKFDLGALRFPMIVKPALEDASVGIASASVVSDRDALVARARYVREHYRQPALVEEFIVGREINVSLLGRGKEAPQILPFFEIDFTDMPADRPKIVSFEGKWVEDSDEFKGTKPVRCKGLSAPVAERVGAVAAAAFAAIELRDYGRVDIRLAADGTPYVIDVNPNCDLSRSAGGFARAAKAGALSYDDVILRIVESALGRRPHADTIPLTPRSRNTRAADRARTEQPVSAGGNLLRVGASRGGSRSA